MGDGGWKLPIRISFQSQRSKAQLDYVGRKSGCQVIEVGAHSPIPIPLPPLPLFDFDLDVDAGRKIQLGQRIDRLSAGVENVDDALVRLQRDFLSTCGERSTVHRCVFDGRGIGPRTSAPDFCAVRTMSAAAWSITA